MTPRLAFTIGYQRADEAAFVDALRVHGVKVVVDTRANPTSRRPEYRQRRLRETLRGAQIEYCWEPSLGVPKRYRPLATTDRESFVAQYRLLLEDAEDALGRVASRSRHDQIALLCFEADERECHRLPLSDELARRALLTFSHLRVRRGNNSNDQPVRPTMVGTQEKVQITGR
jgi:uncharacterized protein (DUF488 family)